MRLAMVRLSTQQITPSIASNLHGLATFHIQHQASKSSLVVSKRYHTQVYTLPYHLTMRHYLLINIHGSIRGRNVINIRRNSWMYHLTWNKNNSFILKRLWKSNSLTNERWSYDKIFLPPDLNTQGLRNAIHYTFYIYWWFTPVCDIIIYQYFPF